jgi:hypothetical protein
MCQLLSLLKPERMSTKLCRKQNASTFFICFYIVLLNGLIVRIAVDIIQINSKGFGKDFRKKAQLAAM